MADWLMRTRALIGDEALNKLQNARVAVLGLGGVGGAAAEALCRSGIGHLLLVDKDAVDETNLNRQLVATRPMIGRPKCEAAAERLRSIAPDCELTLAQEFYLPENRDFLFDFQPDYIIDAIDTVTAKLDLAQECARRELPLLMCLGTGNRLDPSQLRLGDIAETSGCGCPLARLMRRELKKRGILRQRVLFSTELPRRIVAEAENGRHSPASSAFVPPAAGYLLASAVVRDLIGGDAP